MRKYLVITNNAGQVQYHGPPNGVDFDLLTGIGTWIVTEVHTPAEVAAVYLPNSLTSGEFLLEMILASGAQNIEKIRACRELVKLAGGYFGLKDAKDFVEGN